MYFFKYGIFINGDFMNIKVMSFNTQHCKNYITKKIDYDSIINLIKKYDVDIIGLNEIFGKFIIKSQVERIAKKLGYYCYFGKATNIAFRNYGNAIISKYPILNTEIIHIPYPIKFKKNYQKRSILKANILVNNKVLHVFVTHLGLNDDEKENGINTILKNISNTNTILMGDFNMAPDNNIIDKIKLINTDKNNLTWPSIKPKYKLDYIFVSKDIKFFLSDTLNEIISDHLPCITQIRI